MKNKTSLRVATFRTLKRVLPVSAVRTLRNVYQRGGNWIKYGDQWFPKTMAIEITENCNRTCYYCPQSVTQLPIRKMELKIFVKALERVAELNWNGIIDYTFYNEPLLEKNLETYVKMTRAFCPKAIPEIITNADALTEDRVLSLVDAGVAHFSITRHPPYDAKWDAKVLPLAEKFPQYIQLQCIEDNPLSNRGGLVSPRFQVDPSTEGCWGPTEGQIIDINGNYLFCCCDYYRKHPMGNVFTHTILEGWRNAKYAEARASVRDKKPILDVCEGCFERKGTAAPRSPEPQPLAAPAKA